MKWALLAGFLAGMAGCAPAPPPCQPLTFETMEVTVCRASTASDIRTFLNRPSGNPYYSFEAVDAALSEEGAGLSFAMNAGMYHEDRTPVGLYVEAGEPFTALNTTARDGNFGLVPNGVFYVANGRAGVLETNAFAAASLTPDYATQSGPMLVIDGALHPKFNAEGTSRKKRNGVGLSADGETVVFVISEAPVNFHTFARLFRDELETPNALFLDGTVSRLYDPANERSDPGLPMGPIVGVVVE